MLPDPIPPPRPETGSRLARLAPWLAAPGVVALILEPALWLVGTWRDPSYASDGLWVALGVAAALAVSTASGPAPPDPTARRTAWRLLGVTAAIRLAGRLLAVHTLGALALVVDVAALALLLRTRGRPCALHPLPLAGVFAFALPLEHLLQRLLGHPLQWAAAASAETLLSPFAPGLQRTGVLLLHPEVELAVDLPCSGARGAVLLSGLALAIACRRHPGWRGGAAAVAAVAAGAWLANVTRIVALFAGARAGWPVALEPWHGLLGTAALALGALPLLAVASRWPARRPQRGSGWPPGRDRSLPWPAAAAVSLLGLAVAHAPERPVDVASRGRAARQLPERSGTWVGEAIPPSDLERRYFARYGGSVQKRLYRDERRGARAVHTAMLVRTNAPLRHLHGPDRCLLGAGHRVTRLGVRPGAFPTVVYRSEAPDGRAWRVEASFVSDAGARAHDVSQALWHWLARPDDTWSLVERITPFALCERDPARCADFDGALFAALDAPAPVLARAGPTRPPARVLPTPAPKSGALPSFPISPTRSPR